MRDRWTRIAVLAAAVAFVAGCSSSGLDFPDMADLNPFDDNCTTCAQPAPQPACPPVQQPVCAPVQQPIAVQQPVAVAPMAGRPSNARKGEVWCYVRVPGQTRTVTEQVCVRPASTRKEWVPPETRQVNEQVCVRPASRRPIEVPAEYRTVNEQICVAPGRNEWRRVDCADKTQLNAQEQLGECWTLAEIPPQYDTRSKQVCVRPATTRYEEIPAEYSTQTKTVTVRPGYYKDINIPAQYDTRTKTVPVCAPRWEWRRSVACEVPGVIGGAPAPAPAAMGSAPMNTSIANPGLQPAPQPLAPAMGDPDAGIGAPPVNLPAPDPIAPR